MMKSSEQTVDIGRLCSIIGFVLEGIMQFVGTITKKGSDDIGTDIVSVKEGGVVSVDIG
jgi:hypothetical protein